LLTFGGDSNRLDRLSELSGQFDTIVATVPAMVGASLSQPLVAATTIVAPLAAIGRGINVKGRPNAQLPPVGA